MGLWQDKRADTDRGYRSICWTQFSIRTHLGPPLLPDRSKFGSRKRGARATHERKYTWGSQPSIQEKQCNVSCCSSGWPMTPQCSAGNVGFPSAAPHHTYESYGDFTPRMLQMPFPSFRYQWMTAWKPLSCSGLFQARWGGNIFPNAFHRELSLSEVL